MNDRTWLGVDHIPHLGLAQAVVALHGQLVARVNLHTQVALGIDNLDEQRELAAIVLVHLLAHKVETVAVDEVDKRLSLVGTFGHNRNVALNARDFPTLAYVVQVGINALERGNALAAPQHGLEIRLELKWLYILFHCKFKYVCAMLTTARHSIVSSLPRYKVSI